MGGVFLLFISAFSLAGRIDFRDALYAITHDGWRVCKALAVRLQSVKATQGKLKVKCESSPDFHYIADLQQYFYDICVVRASEGTESLALGYRGADQLGHSII